MKKEITAETLIVEALKINPKAADILMSHGMHCLGCAMAHGESIGEAVGVHDIELAVILKQLNEKND